MTIKPCKDCKHCERHDGMSSYTFSTCKLVIATPNRVTGHHVFQYCALVRNERGNCKPEALLFEPKESLWTKLKMYFRKARTSH